MQLLVGHFMDQGLDRLHFAHALLKGDPLINCVVVALGSRRNILKTDRYWTGTFQSFKEHLIIRNIAGESTPPIGRGGAFRQSD